MLKWILGGRGKQDKRKRRNYTISFSHLGVINLTHLEVREHMFSSHPLQIRNCKHFNTGKGHW